MCLVCALGVAQEPDLAKDLQTSQTRAKTFVPSPSASERAPNSGQIRIIEIEYSSRREDVPLNEDKIRQNMRSTKGSLYNQQTIDGDIESLYATGDYSNVQIVTSEARSEDGERGVRLSVLVDPKVRVSAVEATSEGWERSRAQPFKSCWSQAATGMAKPAFLR